MIVDLPDDFRKIIRELKIRPMNIYELRNATGLDERKLGDALNRMRSLNIISYDEHFNISLVEKTYKPRRLR
ncbi:hypothetical protein [Picrophilus oshimae]|nr:hypothetical protein [Picrophilus oshimae]